MGDCQTVFAPLLGWRHVSVTERRPRVDWAYALRDLVAVHFPSAPKIRVVLDNLNTHVAASLYEAFAPAQARRIVARLEWHHTPKHGSWLNRAAIDLSVLGRPCLVEIVGAAVRLISGETVEVVPLEDAISRCKDVLAGRSLHTSSSEDTRGTR